MPARHTIYQLSEFAGIPLSHIGKTGALLAHLWEAQVPLPATICIPTQTLVELAQNTQLHLKLEQIQRNSSTQHHEAVAEQIVYLLKRQHIDRAFLHKLATLYHEYLQSDTVQVYASENIDKHESLVLGDASLIESVLHVWASSISSALCKQPRRRRPVSELVASTAIIITRQPQPDASGLAFSQDPKSHDKTSILLQAVWGAGSSLQHAATLAVDVRTNTIVHRHPHSQTTKLIHGNGEVVESALTSTESNSYPLSDATALALTQLVLHLKRQTLEHVKVSWILSDQSLLITGVSELDSSDAELTSVSQKNSPTTPHQSITKLYVTGGNPTKAAEQLAQPVDGVGILRSEYFLAQYGVHPIQLLQSTQRDNLRSSMLHTIKTYQQESHGKLVLFRTENFTTAELMHLQSGSVYTEPEANPAIGYRGALKNLRQPELLKFQLEVFKDALQLSTSPLGIVFPYVRSPEEGRQLIQYCHTAKLHGPHFAGIWLQLNTPENIINSAAYPLKELAGVIFNVSSVLALAQGIDADNPELQQAYGFPQSVYEHMLDHLVKHHTPLAQLQTLVYLRHFDHEAVTAAVKKGVHGVIVRPEVATLAKAAIIETESGLLHTTRTT